MNETYLPLISTVIPYYNSDFNYFTEAIESVLAQSYGNWEVVVVNDGSNRGNKIALDNYINSLNENRISVIHLEKNQGVSVAKNAGIESSKGEIITFLDSDDLYLPWYYDDIVNSFYKNPELLILHTSNTLYLKLNGLIRIIRHNEFYVDSCSKEEKDSYVYLYFPRLVLKKECFEKLRFDDDFLCSEDTDLSLQIINNSCLLSKSIIMPKPGYVYRLHRSDIRLTHKLDLILNCRKQLIDKYSKADSIGYKVIKRWQNKLDYWKFNNELYMYLKNGSIFNYFRETILALNSFKDKINSTKWLCYVIFLHKFLIPVFGINFLYIKALQEFQYNKYKEFKLLFHQYLNTLNGQRSSSYAIKTFERMFK